MAIAIGLFLATILFVAITTWVICTLAKSTKKFIILPCDYPLPDHRLWQSKISGNFGLLKKTTIDLGGSSRIIDCSPNFNLHERDLTAVHLYLVSEGKIRKGDWFYNPESAGKFKGGVNDIFECQDEEWVAVIRRTERGKGIRKIEATSDSLLRYVSLITDKQLSEWIENTPTGDSATIAYIAMASSMAR